MAKVTIDNLASEIQRILDEYGEDVTNLTEETVKEVAKTGAKAVKSASGIFGGTGKYASGWTSQVEGGRLNTKATIYNGKTPGLPHLLEFGHAKRGGGRVGGRTHIAPVEQEIIDTIQREIEAKL